MERLKFDECKNCRDWSGCIVNCIDTCGKPLDALEEFNIYKDLEEQGKLLKLPCAVGDMTYSVNETIRWITDAIVKKIEIDADGIWVITSSGIFSVEDFEKTVFLTKEAAKATLKELEGGGKGE